METKKSVIDEILDRAEQRPWKIQSAIMGKMPAVLMRAKNISHQEAQDLTLELIHRLGPIGDDSDLSEIKEKLNALINL